MDECGFFNSENIYKHENLENPHFSMCWTFKPKKESPPPVPLIGGGLKVDVFFAHTTCCLLSLRASSYV